MSEKKLSQKEILALSKEDRDLYLIRHIKWPGAKVQALDPVFWGKIGTVQTFDRDALQIGVIFDGDETGAVIRLSVHQIYRRTKRKDCGGV